MSESQFPQWDGKPYYPISRYFRNLFGEKVYKIPVSMAEECPNRLGLRGMQTCVFCDEWGSAAYPQQRDLRLHDQIHKVREHMIKKHRAQAYLVYFQAYTNTFVRLQKLESWIDESLQIEGVKGVVIGTRPDCLSQGVLQMWKKYHEKSFVSVELGVQSFYEDQIEFLRRGHSAKKSVEAIHKIHGETGVDLGIHLIFGNPGETDDQIIETAELCSSLPITHVKLHNLHVLKKTPLEEMYNRGEFAPIEFDAYRDRVILFLQHLDPRIAVHRLSAVASRWNELVAPAWTSYKMEVHQGILNHMKLIGAYQGQRRRNTTMSIDQNSSVQSEAMSL